MELKVNFDKARARTELEYSPRALRALIDER